MNKFEALAWLDARSFIRVRDKQSRTASSLDGDIEVRGVPQDDIPEPVVAHLRVLATGSGAVPCWYDEDDRTWCILDEGHAAATAFRAGFRAGHQMGLDAAREAVAELAAMAKRDAEMSEIKP